MKSDKCRTVTGAANPAGAGTLARPPALSEACLAGLARLGWVRRKGKASEITVLCVVGLVVNANWMDVGWRCPPKFLAKGNSKSTWEARSTRPEWASIAAFARRKGSEFYFLPILLSLEPNIEASPGDWVHVLISCGRHFWPLASKLLPLPRHFPSHTPPLSLSTTGGLGSGRRMR